MNQLVYCQFEIIQASLHSKAILIEHLQCVPRKKFDQSCMHVSHLRFKYVYMNMTCVM